MKFASQHIAILGAGRSGLGAARLARMHGADVTVFDEGDKAKQVEDFKCVIGQSARDLVVKPGEFQQVIISPGLDEHWPLPKKFTLALKTQVSFGDKLGSTTALPPFRQFFGGGPDTIRGYRESRLGPKDSFGNPYGGNLLTVASAEILFPTPDKWKANVRVSAFYDMGNVFSTGNVKFYGIDRVTPVNYKFRYSDLKRSAGIAVQWLAPMGIFRFSYAVPLSKTVASANDIRFPDEREGFQFSIGSAF